MSPTVAPFLAATLLLAGAGVAKAHQPDYTAKALYAAGLPAHRQLVRVGAVGEELVALAALVGPGAVTGSLVAAAYFAFAVFVLVALRRGWALSSCGCFGRPDSRPTYAHVVVNLAAAASATVWAASPSSWGHVFGARQPWHGAPLGLVTIVIAGLAYLVWTNPVSSAPAPSAPAPSAGVAR